jgi:uncharacterized membrane protein
MTHSLTLLLLSSFTLRPVVGIAYGATIQDWTLCKRALKTELISLLVCILVGALVGVCTG